VIRGFLAVFFGLATVVVLMIASGWSFWISFSNGPSDDPKKVAEEFGWFDGADAYRWEPAVLAGTGMTFALARREDGAPTILYTAGHGGMTYTSGWAVEASSVDTESGTAYVGVAIADAETIRFGRGRDALRVPTEPYPGDPTLRLFAVHVPPNGLSHVHPNDIVALDGKGRLLGRQHVNDGKGGFGAEDGLYDRQFKEAE
jgi:hypothetical protein